MLTLVGILGDRPPTDADGFAAFAASLRFPDIHETVRDAEPLDDPVPYRFPASVWRHYERLRQIPEGFAVMGDSMCSFNPIYGQGMSIAALEAVALRRHLERHGRVRSRRFHRQLARLLRPPWQMATGADLIYPGLEEGRSRPQRLLGAYINRLHAAAAHDKTVARSFVYVAGLVDPPQKLLRPLVVSRVFRGRRTRRSSGWSETPATADETV